MRDASGSHPLIVFYLILRIKSKSNPGILRFVKDSSSCHGFQRAASSRATGQNPKAPTAQRTPTNQSSEGPGITFVSSLRGFSF